MPFLSSRSNKKVENNPMHSRTAFPGMFPVTRDNSMLA